MSPAGTGRLPQRDPRRTRTGLLVSLCAALVVVLAAAQGVTAASSRAAGGPIQHVVILFQENHSFDDVFGRFCVDVSGGRFVRSGLNMGCDGVVSGAIASGKTMPLAAAPDVVPNVPHTIAAQQRAIDGGGVDGVSVYDGG